MVAGADSIPQAEPMDWAPAEADATDLNSSPQAPGPPAAVRLFSLSEIKELIFQRLQNGTLSLKPRALEKLLLSLELLKPQQRTWQSCSSCSWGLLGLGCMRQ
jgi:hypothetical protein